MITLDPPPGPFTGDHARALAFCRQWLSADYDPAQHREWLNLARCYLSLLPHGAHEGVHAGASGSAQEAKND